MDTARLSLSAARLLLYLVYAVGPGIVVLKSAEEWMHAAGIGKRQTFYAARDELAQAGFVAVSRRVSRGVALELIPIPSLPLHVGPSLERGNLSPKASEYVSNLLTNIRRTESAADEQADQTQAPSDVEPLMFPSMGHHGDVPPKGTSQPSDVPLEGTSRYVDVPPKGTSDESDVPLRGPSRYVDVPLEGTSLTPDVPPKGTSHSPLAQCVAADRLEGGGELGRRGSPANERRKAQVAAVQAAWASFFPGQPALIPERAKDMLRLSEECAEEVYETLQYVQSRSPDSPLGYALGVMKKRQPSPPPASASPVGSPPSPNAPFEKAEPTPEYLQRIRDAEEFARRMGVSA